MTFDIPLMISIGGFVLWALAERAFHLGGSHQKKGKQVEKKSYSLLSVFWYASNLVSFADRIYLGWTENLISLHWMRWAGAVFVAAGLVIRIAARKELSQQYSVYVETSEEHQLVTGGIYRIIRHPAYLGLMCLFVGIPLAAWSLPGMVVAVVFGIPAIIGRIRIEENALAEWFGEDFREYAKISWRMMPGIW
jgi:protein-S-isoprenylcysteine O-methyltransferase Ste14